MKLIIEGAPYLNTVFSKNLCRIWDISPLVQVIMRTSVPYDRIDFVVALTLFCIDMIRYVGNRQRVGLCIGLYVQI